MHTRVVLRAVAACLVLFAIQPTAYAVPLLDTFGGPIGYGTNTLPANDDGSSSAIDLTPAFPGGLNFFGGPYMQAYVNNNGNITFSGSVGTYTPRAFPIASQPMIAPYWGDVDTRGGGSPANNSVWWHLEPGRMIVTWHNVGYYSMNDSRKMDFQLIITNPLGCRAGDFDVEFRYNRCEWEAGRASGDSNEDGICQASESTCVPAQAGFDAGNSTDFVEIMGSRTGMIRDQLCMSSNVSMPGIWRFSVRGGGVVCPDTGTPCEIAGAVGACAQGITQCMGRDVVCSPIGTMTAERCDGVDNDCNGMTDEGDLCASPDICVRGACVPPCFEGGCPGEQSCNAEGICVETACADVDCPEGQRCSGGVCVGACEGVVCPFNQQCVAGRCTDLCDVLTCASGEVCVDGACVPSCPCRACAADETCLADGSCEPIGCDIVTCDPGFHCEAGSCVDDCAGAVCPSGQVCAVGECVDGVSPMADAGPPAPGVDGGPPAAGTDAGPPGEFDAGDGTFIPRDPTPGCGCRTAGERSTPGVPAGWALLLAPLALLLRRRRR